jgi:segregation and condensation protein A
VFVREPNAEGLPPDPNEKPAVKVTLFELLEAFRAVLKRAEPEPVHQVAAEPVALRDRIDSLLRTLSVARTVEFDSLFGESPTRGFVIVTFLAVLELAKVGAIEAVQADVFGPILIVLAVADVREVTIDLLDEYEGSTALPPPAKAEAGELPGND